MTQRITTLFTAALLVLATGCTFDRQWRTLARTQAVADAPAPEAADPLAGRWEGKWVSERTGHSGKLRAIITPVNATTYRVRYDATYMAVLRFGYGMDLTTSRAPNGATTTFEGQEDLGALAGGMYRYKGTADGMKFHSTYDSSNDNGYFEMTRPRVKQ